MSIGSDEAVAKVLYSYKQRTKLFYSRIYDSKLILHFFDDTILLNGTFHNFNHVGITKVGDC